LKSDNSGPGASTHIGNLTVLNTSTTTSDNPCPLLFTSTTCAIPPCKTYCDGFNAKDSAGNVAVVDIFGYLGVNPPCKAGLPAVMDGGTPSKLSGIWEDNYNSTTMVNLWVLAPTDCSGVNLANPYAGTATPPQTNDIHALVTNFVSNAVVSVHGVVTGRWTAAGAFGFTMQDPTGGPQSAIKVMRGKSSTSTSAAPNVGDYVLVNGVTWLPSGLYPAISI
jgi:hypothetical protein